MEMVNQTPLFDPVAAQYVLGSLMRDPQILTLQDKYILSIDDFDERVYTILFGAVCELAYQGALSITPQNIDLYLTSFPSQYDYYKNKNGSTLTGLIYQMAENYDEGQFNFYYNRLKKFSALRELRNRGFNVEEFYNPSFLDREEQEARFNKLTVKEILDHFRNKIQLVENRNLTKTEGEGQYASKGIRQLFESLQEVPEMGIEFGGAITDYATRGCRKGKMYLYSANSGGGKTRTMVGTACRIAYPRIENGKIITPKDIQPVLFITTEQQPDEIQTLILSYISGVNEEKILLGSCTPDEKMLVRKAIDIMEQYEKNFVIEAMPNPSVQTLKALITNYILKYEIEYIFYDYIFTSAGLMEEFRSVGLREDVVLMMLANTLKEIAAVYNVFLMTGTQLNGSWEGKTVRNANVIRGSKAVADKIDVGMIGIRVPEEEMKMVETYCSERGIRLPNVVIDFYKNRRGRMCDIKVFRYFDYGTCRIKDLFATTTSYQILTDMTIIEREEESEPLVL